MIEMSYSVRTIQEGIACCLPCVLYKFLIEKIFLNRIIKEGTIQYRELLNCNKILIEKIFLNRIIKEGTIQYI